MSDLALFEELSLPLDAATQTLAFIGRKGAGKTYAAGKLVELLLDAGVQVVVLDTVGNWYGLRLAADGKSPGFDVPVLGGLRGDVPLTPAAGEAVADVVVDTGRSLVVDLSQWSKGDRQRFATAFAERLWLRKKGETEPAPVHLVIEESQLLIPQFVRGDAARMVGIFEEIVRLGRNYGIGVSLLSQRPQSVNKEALTQTECLVVLQVNGTPERKALKEWIVDQGLDVNLLTELPGLPIGTAYVWSPQWLRYLGKQRVARKRTFDASATPKVGERRSRGALAPVDLVALTERLASTIEQAKADDPKELRRQLAAVRQELGTLQKRTAQQPAPAPERIVERIEVPLLDEAQLQRLQDVTDSLSAAAMRVIDAAGEIRSALVQVRGSMVTAAAAAPPVAARTPAPAPARPVTAPRQQSAPSTGEPLSNYARGLLETLARRHPMRLTRAQISTLSGRRPRSSAFSAALSELSRCGVVELVEGQYQLTEAGLAEAGALDQAAETPEQVLEMWRAALPAYERDLLDALVAAYPRSLGRSEIAQQTGRSLTSSAFGAALSTLAKNGLIESASGGYRASDTLFLSEAAR